MARFPTPTTIEQLSAAQARMLRDLVRWHGLSTFAEEDVGLRGAAFWRVIGALQDRGLVDGNNEPTEAGIALVPSRRPKQAAPPDTLNA